MKDCSSLLIQPSLCFRAAFSRLISQCMNPVIRQALHAMAPILLLPYIGSLFHFLVLCLGLSSDTSSFLRADLMLPGILGVLQFFKNAMG